MKIHHFISESIKQVVQGLLEAQAEVAVHGVDIKTSGGDVGYSEMDFDLAVTTRTNKDRGEDVELSVLGMEVKLGKSKDSSHTVASRLKFSVQFSVPEEEMKLAAQGKKSLKGLT